MEKLEYIHSMGKARSYRRLQMRIAATNNQLTTTLNDWNVADELKNMNLEEIRAIQKSESLPFAVGALNLTGGLNLGSIIRSAEIGRAHV